MAALFVRLFVMLVGHLQVVLDVITQLLGRLRIVRIRDEMAEVDYPPDLILGEFRLGVERLRVEPPLK